jgi:hypothetical protein
MLGVNEMITREEIAIMFYDRNIAARFPKDAKGVLLP